MLRKILPLFLCLTLTGCYTPPTKKSGIALGFQTVKRNDPALLAADNGALPSDNAPTPSTPASPAAVGAASGAVVAVAAAPSATFQALAAGAVAAPVIAVGAVAVAAGAATAALMSVVMPDKPCSDGWALFTFQTEEGEVKTVKQPRSLVCELKPGEVFNYYQDKTGMLVERN